MARKLTELTKDELIAKIADLEDKLKKRYGLVWDREKEPEKIVVDCERNVPVLQADKTKAIINSGEDNILIEGDNYHALTCLNYTHQGKVDFIYIDPPYNTGNKDFIYNDHFVDKDDSWKHSKWLNFMEKRLILAKHLLAEDGLIAISIDDNEQAQLRMLCDAIFNGNFINQFVWKRNSSGKTEKEKFTVNTEYVLLYSKTTSYVLHDVYKPLSEATKSLYKKDDHDGRGRYRLYPLQKPSSPGPETTYDYVDNNGKIWKCPPKGWRIKYSKLKALENDGRLCLENNSLSEKAYWNERANEGKRIDSLWDDLPENSSASRDLANLFNGEIVFDTPKPIDLVKRCIGMSHKDAIVLDFFAGSGTTGHAVLDMNKDGGRRRFILCTNNENNICTDVCYPRLKGVINGYKEGGKGQFIAGLGGNLTYYKTALIPVERIDKVTDRQRVEITRKAGTMIGLKESTLKETELTEYYQIFTDHAETRKTAIYFREDESKMDELVKKLADVPTALYVFSYSKVDKEAYKELGKNIRVEDIPEPLLQIYKEINLKIEEK